MFTNAAPGIEVSIRCNGAYLQEYDGEADGAETGFKYVEASSGSGFSVSLREHPQTMIESLEDDISIEVQLNGQSVGRRVHQVRSLGTATCEINGCYSSVNGQQMFQKFTFGDLVTSEGSAVGIKPDDVKQLGDIKVNLRWVRRLSTYFNQHSPPKEINGGDSIPEKCLKGKAMSSKASLEKARPIPGKLMTTEVSYPRGRQPFATFVFKYRSKKDLQIEGIIARSVSPVPLEERNEDDLTIEEARELVRRMRTQGKEIKKESKINIKKERRTHATLVEDDDDEDEVTITEERTAKRSRLSNDSAVEIVDLTDD